MFFSNVEYVVERDDAKKLIVDVDDGKGKTVETLKGKNRCFLIISGEERFNLVVHDLANARIRTRQQDFTDVNVVDERTVLGDVQIVECLGILAVVAHVIKCLLNGPVLLDNHVVGRHQTSNRIFRPVQQCEGNAALFCAERVDQLGYDIAWEIFEQLCTVVRRHVVEECTDFFTCHVVKELLLRVEFTVGECFCCDVLGKEPKHNHPTLLTEVGE